MKRLMTCSIAVVLTVLLFWQYFTRGYIPIPSSFMVSWYEPWKSEFSKQGVPTIPHKAVGDDVFRQLYPFKIFARDMFLRGMLPFWNPYNGSGQPMLANIHPGYFNPLSLLILFGNEKHSWAWYIIAHVLVLFFSAYLYSRTIRLSQTASIVSATIVTLSGAVVVRYIYGEFLFSFAMLPILLSLIERWQIGRKRAAYFISPIIAFMLVSVQPQISLYVLVTACWYAWVRLSRKNFLTFISLCIIGVGMASIQLVPTLELWREANVTSASSVFIFQKFLMPVTHLVSMVIPNYFGNSGTYNFWGQTDYTETVVSLGLLPVALAVLALLHKKKATESGLVSFFGWASAISIAFTLDWPLTRLLSQTSIPILSTSIPTRLYLFTSFFIAVLAGFGIDVWKKADTSDQKRTITRIILGFGVLGIGIFIATNIAEKMGFIICPSQVSRCANVALRNTIFEIVAFVCGAALLFLGNIRIFVRFRKVLYAGIIFLLIGIGIYNGWKFLPMSPAQYVGATHPIFEVLPSVSPSRIAGIGSASFATDFATQYRYFDTNYYDPLYIRRYGELVSYVNTGDREKGLTRSDVNVVSDATVSAEIAFRRERFWDMTGTSLLVTKKNDAIPITGRLVWEDANWNVTKRNTPLPRAYLVTKLEIETDTDRTLAKIFSPRTDISKTAFVDESILLVPEKVSDVGNVRVDTYAPNSVALTVESPSEAFLVLSDTFYPGWKASVDGISTHVYRTNYAFRGIVVPTGKHRVVFSYEPDSFKIGVIISLLSLLAWGGTTVVMVRRKAI